MKKLALPLMTSTIGNPAFRNFVKSQKAYCTADQYCGSLGLQVPVRIAKFSDLVIARLLAATRVVNNRVS